MGMEHEGSFLDRYVLLGCLISREMPALFFTFRGIFLDEKRRGRALRARLARGSCEARHTISITRPRRPIHTRVYLHFVCVCSVAIVSKC